MVYQRCILETVHIGNPVRGFEVYCTFNPFPFGQPLAPCKWLEKLWKDTYSYTRVTLQKAISYVNIHSHPFGGSLLPIIILSEG